MGRRSCLWLLVALLLCVPLAAQQTGEITGKVTSSDGQALPGATIEAKSNMLPQARVTVSSSNGDYRLPALPPGTYNLQFSLAGMQTVNRSVQVLLGQTASVNASLGLQGVAETITVTAGASLVDPTSTEIKSGIANDMIEQLPVGQDYRDLLKLAPAVQYTQDSIRGPSAGGSGQDNTYQFDGVMVNLPLFGTLSAEPSSHDIQQISIVKGGAKAVDFNRSAGFTVDSVSKSGTSDFKGEISYQLQSEAMTADRKTVSTARYEKDRTWITANFGGPILKDQLFFYASYYRPEEERQNRSNSYGEVPDFESTRDEVFGKLTYTPLSSVLLHASYRHSDREEFGSSVASGTSAGTTSTGGESGLRIGIVEGSWVVNPQSYATMKFTDFVNETASRPDNLLDLLPSVTLGTKLNVNALETMGRFLVPVTVTGQDAFNAFVQPLIDKYGYVDGTTRRGGGYVGVGRDIEEINFYRDSYQFGYNYTLTGNVSHDLHVGYQFFKDQEDFSRVYNGWGDITVPGGRTTCPANTDCTGQAIYYQARFIRGALAEFPLRNIVSDYESQNIELNDSIRWNDWTFNVGVLLSQDTLYGQGLKEEQGTLSGFVLSPGTRYRMYQIGWEKMIQPRLGATWAYNGQDSVYVNFAKYNPSANSLPRAAAWDRNNVGLFYDAFFDATGSLIGYAPVGSSSGKLFQEDLDPRHTNEYLIGTSQQITPRFSARLYGRYRYSTNFWEDTNNDARIRWAPDGYPKELYIDDLQQKRVQIGNGVASGSTYVIAELDGAFTKYYEATTEADYREGNLYLRGSYTWSHYYGNFDQDNTSTDNDLSLFIGSSNIADGPGRQLWDNKYGDLRGDRRHLLKIYGVYSLPWSATAGFFGLYQSGQPWETWSYEPYIGLPGFSGTSDLIRYAEPAGSRRSPAHYQVDFTYTQNIPVSLYNVQLQLDVFNVLDKQTGYSFQPAFHSATYGQPRLFFEPRRYQVAARFQF